MKRFRPLHVLILWATMGREQILQNVGLGAAAGLIGTAAMQAARSATQKMAPETSVPVRREPGKYVAERVVPQRAGNALKTAASTMLAFGYGSAGAAVYTAIRDEPSILVDGALLGITIWGASYLGWLPGSKLTPPVTKHAPARLPCPFFSTSSME